VIITKLQVAPVEFDVSSESSCALRLARHSLNAWARHVECVESSRDKWNLSLSQLGYDDRPKKPSEALRRPCHVRAKFSTHTEFARWSLLLSARALRLTDDW